MKKILVADDSLTIQKVIRLALSNESYEIQAVSEGKDALERIALFRPHVVLIDVSLPGHSAFEVKRKLNESPEFKHTQFVLMSSAFEQVDEGQAAEADFAGRLVKPFDPGNLREVLQSVLSEIPDEDGSKISLSPPDPALVPNVRVDDEDEDDDEDYAGNPVSFKDADQDRTIALSPAEGAFSGNEPPKLSDDLWDGGSSGANTDSTDDSEEEESRHASPDEDIRKLTESTIKMSGLDDFQWSVNETGRRDEEEDEVSIRVSDDEPNSHFTIDPPDDDSFNEPSLEPHPNMMDTGGSSFEMPLFAKSASPSLSTSREKPAPRIANKSASSAASGHDHSARSVYDHAPDISEPEPPFQLGGGGFPADDLRVSEFDQEFETQEYSGVSSDSSHEGASDSIAISNDQIEEIVRKQVQEKLQEITRKLLPDIAERIIKEEIHRMLSNPP